MSTAVERLPFEEDEKKFKHECGEYYIRTTTISLARECDIEIDDLNMSGEYEYTHYHDSQTGCTTTNAVLNMLFYLEGELILRLPLSQDRAPILDTKNIGHKLKQTSLYKLYKLGL